MSHVHQWVGCGNHDKSGWRPIPIITHPNGMAIAWVDLIVCDITLIYTLVI